MVEIQSLAYQISEFSNNEYLERLEKNPWNISQVPAGLQTCTMWLKCVRKNGMILKEIINMSRDDDIVIFTIPEEVYLEAIRQNPQSFYFIPENERTQKIKDVFHERI